MKIVGEKHAKHVTKQNKEEQKKLLFTFSFYPEQQKNTLSFLPLIFQENSVCGEISIYRYRDINVYRSF